MAGVSYRSGVDRRSGRILTGWPHCAQSLEQIWMTMPGERLMRLGFGTDLRQHLAKDLTPTTALEIYSTLVQSAHTYEPEYRIASLQLVKLAADGTLRLRHSGTYYPEGRLGNYAIAVPASAAASRLVGG